MFLQCTRQKLNQRYKYHAYYWCRVTHVNIKYEMIHYAKKYPKSLTQSYPWADVSSLRHIHLNDKLLVVLRYKWQITCSLRESQSNTNNLGMFLYTHTNMDRPIKTCQCYIYMNTARKRFSFIAALYSMSLVDSTPTSGLTAHICYQVRQRGSERWRSSQCVQWRNTYLSYSPQA